MTLRQLIERLEYVGRCVSNSDIPVYLNNTHGNISSIEISQDNNGKYYVNIDTIKY